MHPPLSQCRAYIVDLFSVAFFSSFKSTLSHTAAFNVVGGFNE